MGRDRHHPRKISPNRPRRDRGRMRSEESRGDSPGIIHNIIGPRALESRWANPSQRIEESMVNIPVESSQKHIRNPLHIGSELARMELP